MSLLGIDVGTTGCKAIIFSEDGEILSSSYQEYNIIKEQPDYAELDAKDVWNKIKKVIAAASISASCDPVKALSISSLGEAVVPVTKDKEIIAPSILFVDNRGQEYLADIASAVDKKTLYRINGNTLGVHYSLPKLMWIRNHQSDIYAKADKFLLWGAFVAYMLGGEPAVDYSLASRTLLFDINKKNWSQTMLNISGIDIGKLPSIVESGTVIGKVSKDIANELCLPVDTKIVAGGHDQCLNAVGCGVLKSSQMMYGMGTFLCAVPVFEQRPNTELMIKFGLNTEDHVRQGRFVSFIYNQGGCLVKWFRDTFAALEHHQSQQRGDDIYEKLFDELPEQPVDIAVLPYFTNTGPPKFLDNPSGLIAGLKLATTRGEILKGIVQGATFYLRKCIEVLPEFGIDISEYRAVGGGSNSDTWLQLSADILGKPFVRPKVNEAGSLGAAIVAGVGLGIFSSLEEGVAQIVKPDRTFEPQMNLHSKYMEKYQKYKNLEIMAEGNFSSNSIIA